VRAAFRSHRKSGIGSPPEPGTAEVKDALRAHGGGTLSWMTTWDGNSYARAADGIVAYQRRAGVALALADPLGPAASREASVREFIHAAEVAGLVPCFFSADERTRAAVPSSWRSLVVADDTIVDLPGLEFTGKRWNSVRSSLNRAGREEMTFRMTRLEDEPWGVQQQLRAISEMWVGDKGLPEMGFTLGTLAEAEDPEVRLALAIAPNGDVDGFLSWLPVYGPEGTARGWTLDLMRRRDGGFAPVMEFLIGSSAKLFSEEGAEIMSLSGAPLAHDYPPDAGMIAALSDKLADALEPVYGFQSLHRFKEKFHPRYETMYLLYRDESDLTRIGGALTRAFLPDATLRQFAGAGMELVRGDRG
jgi:phosphatidylglycerol lysyltransferase